MEKSLFFPLRPYAQICPQSSKVCLTIDEHFVSQLLLPSQVVGWLLWFRTISKAKAGKGKIRPRDEKVQRQAGAQEASHNFGYGIGRISFEIAESTLASRMLAWQRNQCLDAFVSNCDWWHCGGCQVSAPTPWASQCDADACELGACQRLLPSRCIGRAIHSPSRADGRVCSSRPTSTWVSIPWKRPVRLDICSCMFLHISFLQDETWTCYRHKSN